MTIKAEGSADRVECLSALADGELDGSDVALACEQWRDDVTARARWHEYQLIGDVLRSEDLASTAVHDSAFLRSLRQRLDAEPVVLAPAPLPAPLSVDETRLRAPVVLQAGARRRGAWFMPSAVAATLAAVVVGGLMSQRQPADNASPAIVSVAPPAVAEPADPVAEPTLTAVNGRLIRDAQLDRYLAAHQQWSGGSVVGGHAAYLRQASVDVSQRAAQR